MMRLVTLVFAIFLLIGCSRTVAADTGVDVAKKKWEADGWVFHEAFGTAIAGAEEVSFMSSSTARSVSAFSFDGVERKQKEYRQSDQLYLVVTMADRSGKSYALVFRKEKKANQAAQTTPGLRPSVSDL
jgi:uncharacterized lipoprotein NlpE involved in copper resistance